MIVRTKFAALIPAIERAGHTAVLEPVEETVREMNAEPSIRERVEAGSSLHRFPEEYAKWQRGEPHLCLYCGREEPFEGCAALCAGCLTPRTTSSLAIPSLPNLRPSADIDPHRCGPGYCDGGGPRACTRRPRASTTCPNFSYARPE